MSSSPMIAILILAAISTINAHFTPCTESFILAIQNRNLSNCKKLTTLEAEFAWKINEKNMQQIEILFGTRLYGGLRWLAWGINPGKLPQMVGTRAIIGIRHPNGSFLTDTYHITKDTKMGCKLLPARLINEAKTDDEVKFQNLSMDYLAQLDYYLIQGSVVVPADLEISKLNHVWQIGYLGDDEMPLNHPTILQNVDSTETINFRTGLPVNHVGLSTQYLRTVHGILNIAGWGVILPIGVIVARYFKYPLECGKWWIKLHLSCQIVGYSIGTAGWIVGLALGRASKFYSFKIHGLYSIFIFIFTTLQMLALRLRPAETDEYRKNWNMYHHFLGYALLAVISINIFRGIGILKPAYTWKWAYTGILVAFAVTVAVLEIYTWTKFKATNKSTNPAQEEGSASGSIMPTPRP